MGSETTNLSTENLSTKMYVMAAISVIAATLLFVLLLAGQGRGLYMTSGVWAGLAVDLADGTLYRPVHDETGFGGTRYMPLQFILHAIMLSIINHPAIAAHMVVLASAIALFVCLYKFLRAYDLPTTIAGASATIAMGALTIQYGLISTRGDLLAAALSLWGVVLGAKCTPKNVWRTLTPAALLFALAFMAKFTTVFGVASVVLFFALNGRLRHAVGLGALTAALAAGLLCVTHVVSEGRALESFLACAAGGTSVVDFMLSPFKFLYAARVDVSFLMFFACACMALFKRRRLLNDLPSLLFVFTTIATIVIMASPGTDLSHMIDLQMASVALIAVQASQSASPKGLKWGLPVAGFAGAISIALTALVFTAIVGESRWVQQDRIMAIVGKGDAPMLADDPWVPILAEEHPFVLDTFAVRTASEQRPEVAEDLFAKLDQHFFRAVVLYIPNHLRDYEESINGTWRGKRWFGELFYPPGFEARLLNSYEPKDFIGEYIVLLPK